MCGKWSLYNIYITQELADHLYKVAPRSSWIQIFISRDSAHYPALRENEISALGKSRIHEAQHTSKFWKVQQSGPIKLN